MPINQTRLNTKLNAILSKDVVALVSKQVTIPYLAKPYTAAQLQSWLDKRSSRLNEMWNMTDAEVSSLRDTLYNGLNTAGKNVADKIIAGENFTIPSNTTSANYDRLIGIILITFVLD
jgi:hypothetical protein